jgi:formylglycine-generating enzyme required for sulfatase activity
MHLKIKEKLFTKMFFLKLIIFNVLLKLCKSQASDKDILSYKHLESFVELTGGEFSMGVSDIDGINYEHPLKRAIVKPFK